MLDPERDWVFIPWIDHSLLDSVHVYCLVNPYQSATLQVVVQWLNHHRGFGTKIPTKTMCILRYVAYVMLFSVFLPVDHIILIASARPSPQQKLPSFTYAISRQHSQARIEQTYNLHTSNQLIVQEDLDSDSPLCLISCTRWEARHRTKLSFLGYSLVIMTWKPLHFYLTAIKRCFYMENKRFESSRA